MRILQWMCVLLVLTTNGCVSIDLLTGSGAAPLEESLVRGSEGPKILLVDIDGVIGGAPPPNPLFGGDQTSMVSRIRETLDRARADEEVRAVLLRIDSPGGTVTASEQIYAELLRFKQDRNVPVFAQFLGTAASGGFYIAMAADEVQAHPTTVTGSIGVIFSSVNFAGLMDKLGIEDQTITGGEFKDSGSPFRRLTRQERAQLQSIVDDLHAQFRAVVEKGRPDLSEEQVRNLANGRIYSASFALENGLVDRIGTLEESVTLLEQKLGASESRVVTYHRPSEARRNIYMKSPSPSGRPATAAGLRASLANLGLEQILARPGFHYLWWPGLGD